MLAQVKLKSKGELEVMSPECKTILYAEDDRGLRRAVACELREHSYEVFEAKDPDQAISALKQQDFDMVLLDLVMPEHDVKGGEKVVQFMRDSGIHTPVLLLTAFGYNGPAERAMRTYPGLIKGVLTKTFDPIELLHLIEQTLA